MSMAFHVADATAEPLLQRLDGLQRSGTGWRARCPACSGRSRKLSVTERDGRVLVHCFGGCPAEEVLTAVGLTWADIMPPRHWPESEEERRVARRAIREAGWAAALTVLAVEAKVVLIASHELVAARPLPAEDQERLAQAVARIDHAAAVLTQPRPVRTGVPA
ncbi:DNA primase [Luteimonas sp. YGD11-2]|uniref:DNA primase n=1 Tax=Luteimonas sp. YGD11-2 TaxID=2508168 RepID=UPI00100A835F|nr:DNA primase [Luteimonas sp. YGD11-2]